MPSAIHHCATNLRSFAKFRPFRINAVRNVLFSSPLLSHSYFTPGGWGTPDIPGQEPNVWPFASDGSRLSCRLCGSPRSDRVCLVAFAVPTACGRLSHLECIHTQKSPVSSVNRILTKSPVCKSFRTHTYAATGAWATPCRSSGAGLSSLDRIAMFLSPAPAKTRHPSPV